MCYKNFKFKQLTIFIVLTLLFLYSKITFAQDITVNNILCNHKENPLGITDTRPVFTWILKSNKRNLKQSNFQIQVANSTQNLIKEENLLWDSKKVMSEQSVDIAYEGQTLKSNQKYYWRMRVTDNQGQSSP